MVVIVARDGQGDGASGFSGSPCCMTERFWRANAPAGRRRVDAPRGGGKGTRARGRPRLACPGADSGRERARLLWRPQRRRSRNAEAEARRPWRGERQGRPSPLWARAKGLREAGGDKRPSRKTARRQSARGGDDWRRRLH